jgi:formylglycine-generating enzyme required for sulfatase activity
MRLRKTFLCSGTRWILLMSCRLAFLAAALPAQGKNFVIELGGGVKMEFILIPAGSFMMGSDLGDSDEKPVHKVTITKAFYIGKYEVTQEQWQALMGVNPSKIKGPKRPVEQVSWFDCQDFLSKLESKVRGLRPGLPTEAQWEYACRAGSTSAYYFGNSQDDVSQYAWSLQNSDYTTHPVGEKKPNAWGLYDMAGNIWEWCADQYWENQYSISSEQDPKGVFGDTRVVRGGSWFVDSDFCRSAIRYNEGPAVRFGFIGFRVVLEK